MVYIVVMNLIISALKYIRIVFHLVDYDCNEKQARINLCLSVKGALSLA